MNTPSIVELARAGPQEQGHPVRGPEGVRPRLARHGFRSNLASTWLASGGEYRAGDAVGFTTNPIGLGPAESSAPRPTLGGASAQFEGERLAGWLQQV